MLFDPQRVFCGPPGIGLRQLAGARKANDVIAYFESRQAVYVQKGRTAIRLACELLGLGPGSEILAPSYNCGSEIDALMSSGASVALYRINGSALVDISDLEMRITRRTKSVYVTHYFGFPQNLSEIKRLCAREKLSLIEDCALTLFSSEEGEMIGTRGDISIFSLPKTLPVADGGILLVNNSGIVKRPIKLLRPDVSETFVATLPWLKSAFLKWLSDRTPIYGVCARPSHREAKAPDTDAHNIRPDMPVSYYYEGHYTGKGISSLSKRMLGTFVPNEIRAKRRNNFDKLLVLLDQCPASKPLFRELPDGICPLSFPILVENRNELVEKLKKRSIDAKAWWKGFHRSLTWSEFPDACYLKDNLLVLPVHQDLSDKAIEYIAASFRVLTLA